MALTKRVALYEILIRLTDRGGVAGAHVVEIEHVIDGDEIVTSKVLSPRGITAAEVGEVIGETNAGLFAEIDKLRADLSAAETAKIEAETARDAAVSESVAHTARIAELEALLHPIDANGFAVLSAVQVRLALLAAGVTAQMVNNVIDAMPPDQKETARTFWEYAVQFERSHAFITVFSDALGLTNAQVDQMWYAAARIN